MQKKFYSHLVQVEYIERELDTLDLSGEEKKELLNHVHSSIHYKVLDVILSDLSEDDKKKFIEHLNYENHDALWKHLLENTVDIEEKIKHAAFVLGREFLLEINKHKEKKI